FQRERIRAERAGGATRAERPVRGRGGDRGDARGVRGVGARGAVRHGGVRHAARGPDDLVAVRVPGAGGGRSTEVELGDAAVRVEIDRHVVASGDVVNAHEVRRSALAPGRTGRTTRGRPGTRTAGCDGAGRGIGA